MLINHLTERSSCVFAESLRIRLELEIRRHLGFSGPKLHSVKTWGAAGGGVR